MIHCDIIELGGDGMVAKQNTRILVTLSKEDFNKLQTLATKEKRSISNLCGKILSDYIESLSKDNK